MEDNLINISSLSEYAYCPRRFYLRYIEKVEGINEYMVDGTIRHNNIHNSKIEKRKSFIKMMNMSLHSHNYSLIGKSDLIEFTKSNSGTFVPLLEDNFNIYPVEYKHGKVRNEEEYEIQLCAQCFCLEEMFNCNIEKGAIYYINSNIRKEITFTNALRNKTEQTINAIKKELETQSLISPILKKSCKKCALIEICNPNLTIIDNYIKELWEG